MVSDQRTGLLRNLTYAFGALVLVGGWTFFYIQSRGVDLTAANEALATLADLRAVDRRWNDRLVQARHAPAPGAGPVAPVAAPGRTTHAQLQFQVFRFTSRVPGRELAALKDAFEEKAELVARYTAIADKTPGAGGASDPRTDVDALFEKVWLASAGPRLDLVTRSLQQALGEAIDNSELARVFLLYYSGFMVVVLGHMAWGLASSRKQLDQANLRLREANQSLEARVKTRTKELSDALAKLKESEALLVQSEKMSSLGQMVAGIAHEVNTPLAYVKASLEAVQARIASNARLATETGLLLELLSTEGADESRLESQFSVVRGLIEDLLVHRTDEQIGNAVNDGLYGIGQISEIVSNLKDFSRLDRSKVADYDLHAGLESTLRIARMHLGNRQVKKEFGNIPHVSCSASEINQVFLNLISNATHATTDPGGIIILSTGKHGADRVWVDVIDNGHGIPADILTKIFDPFFTTKTVGKGTGLGLSICYKIVENHGGKLEVESVVGRGTRFRVNLPVAQAAVAAA